MRMDDLSIVGGLENGAVAEIEFDHAVNYLCWRGLPVQDAQLVERHSVDRLSATCMYLEGLGIKPDVHSIALFKRGIEYALHDEASKKILFLFCLQPSALDRPHAFTFTLERNNSGNIEHDVARILKEAEHYKNLLSGCGDYFVDCIICTQEAYQHAKEKIAYHSIPYLATSEDEKDIEKQAALQEIYATLESLQPNQLPLARSIEDRLIGPYLYQIVASRARRGLGSVRGGLNDS